MKNLSIYSLAVAGTILVAGCGSGTSEPKHTIRPPDPPATNHIPSTKEEKIAAIKKAPISDEMKKQAIDKVNAAPGP